MVFTRALSVLQELQELNCCVRTLLSVAIPGTAQTLLKYLQLQSGVCLLLILKLITIILRAAHDLGGSVDSREILRTHRNKNLEISLLFN